MKRISYFIILFYSAFAFADNRQHLIAPDSISIVPGDKSIFSIYFHNTQSKQITLSPPATVTCRFTGNSLEQPITTTAVSASTIESMDLKENNYLKVSYNFTVPELPAGTVQMDIPNMNAPPVILTVSISELGKTSDGTLATAGGTNDHYDSFEDLFRLYQPYLANISAYNPMYFLVGTDPGKTKFQISFKYQLFRKEKPLAIDYPWLTGFHFGYTQASYWDLASDSEAFEDTSYNPELLFISSNLNYHPFNAKALFIQTGIQHDSNGRGGDQSRSSNIAYIKPILIFYSQQSKLGLQIAPRVWAYFLNDNETNADLDDYRGYFDLQLKAGKADSFVLDTNMGWANKGLSFQTDLTYPLHRFFADNFDIYLHVQYANRLGESLLKYQRRVEALRIGFGIVR